MAKGDKGLVLDTEAQAKIDSLKANATFTDSIKLYPFNPNFITDYKGYTLGMTPAQIDRLHAYRSQDKFVNTPEEFQEVTAISDSILFIIAPFFKFPEWTQKSWDQNSANKSNRALDSSPRAVNEVRAGILDLNTASAEDLRAINGIGEVLSDRIVRFRTSLGGFLVEEQLYDVYGLEPEVVERTLLRFSVVTRPEIEKININTAEIDEIATLTYFNFDLAGRIIAYRQEKGRIDSFDELNAIAGFPKEKIDRIRLYLSL